VSIYSSFLDSASDTNTLNSQGIVTAFQAFGTGIRVWGNRSSGFPTYTTPDVFIPIRRTMDVIEQSVMLSMMQFLDQPISNGLISSILASCNSFLRILISRGALVAGAATYNPAENPSAQIAAGQLVFDIDCAAGRALDFQRVHGHDAAQPVDRRGGEPGADLAADWMIGSDIGAVRESPSFGREEDRRFTKRLYKDPTCH